MVSRRFYTAEEIAKYLGFSLSAIRKWIRHGEIPFCKLNGGIRFDIYEIEKWTQKKK